MPVLVACPSCSGRLRVPETAVGRNVRCPKCSHQFPFALPEEVEEADEVVEEEAAAEPARRSKGIQENAPAARSKPSVVHDNDDSPEDDEPQELEEVPEGERHIMDQPKKKKKKKRRRRRQLLAEDERDGNVTWHWWVFGGGGIALVQLVMLTFWIFGGEFLRIFGAIMFFQLPLGTLIFFAAMFLASIWFGALEMGQLHVTGVKAYIAVLLITAVNLFLSQVFFMPMYMRVGGTLAMWAIVIIAVFRFDPWEAMMVAVINWVLNFGLNFVLLMILLGAAAGGGGGKGKDRDADFNPPQRGRPGQQQQQVQPPDDDNDP